MRAPTALTMHNAGAVLEQGLAAIAGGQTEIDLAALAELDSAAVATLLAWRRAAQAKGAVLNFVNLPASLQSLVQLYGVDDLLAS